MPDQQKQLGSALRAGQEPDLARPSPLTARGPASPKTMSTPTKRLLVSCRIYDVVCPVPTPARTYPGSSPHHHRVAQLVQHRVSCRPCKPSPAASSAATTPRHMHQLQTSGQRAATVQRPPSVAFAAPREDSHTRAPACSLLHRTLTVCSPVAASYSATLPSPVHTHTAGPTTATACTRPGSSAAGTNSEELLPMWVCSGRRRGGGERRPKV